MEISCYQERPPENTRWLITRNLDSLVTMAINEATLFQNTNRSKAMALDQLKHTLLIAEDKIAKHTERVLKTLVKISQTADEIPESPKKIQQIVKVIGRFVTPSYYIPLLTDILSQQQFKHSHKNTVSLLNILSDMLQGTQGVNEHMDLFFKLLLHYQQLFLDNDEGSIVLFKIVATLLQKITEISPEMLHVMFQITINVQATRSIPENIRQRTPEVLTLLAEKGSYQSVPELHAAEIGPILSSLLQNKQYTHWNKTSKNRFKFDTILRNCSSEVSRFLQDILQVFQFLLNPQSDIEVRIDTLVLIEYLLGVPELKGALSPISEQLLKKGLLQAIQWKVGKPQIKIRKAGVINIIALIQRGIIGQDQLLDSFKDLLPPLKNCLNDDWAPELRLASCQLLQQFLLATKYILIYLREQIGDDELRELYPVLLQRLDDSQNPIRLKVTAALNVFFSCRYIKLSESTMEYVISSLFVHFDDSAEDIRSAVFSNLRMAAVVNPKLVCKQAHQHVQRMMHKDLCRQLIEYCEERIQELDN